MIDNFPSVQNYIGLTKQQLKFNEILTKGMSCLCSTHWKLDQAEVGELWNVMADMMRYGPEDNGGTWTQAGELAKRNLLVSKFKAAAPTLLGSTSICGSPCQTAISTSIDLLLDLVPQMSLSSSSAQSAGKGLGAWSSGSLSTTFPLDTSSALKANLGSNFVACLCATDYVAIAEAVFDVPWYMFASNYYSYYREHIARWPFYPLNNYHSLNPGSSSYSPRAGASPYSKRGNYYNMLAGTIAGGEPWMTDKGAKSIANAINQGTYKPFASGSCSDHATWCLTWDTYEVKHPYPTALDTDLVMNRMFSAFGAMRSQACGGACMTFLKDLLSLGMHTAMSACQSRDRVAQTECFLRPEARAPKRSLCAPFALHLRSGAPKCLLSRTMRRFLLPAEYYWPSQAVGIVTDASVADIPDEANVSAVVSSMFDCACTANITQIQEYVYPNPKIDYLILGTQSPYQTTLEAWGNLTYSGIGNAFCASSDCMGAFAKLVKMLSPAMAKVLTAPGAILRGSYYESQSGSSSSTLVATDPPLFTKGTLTPARLNSMGDSLLDCACYHLDPANGARNMITFFDGLSKNASLGRAISGSTCSGGICATSAVAAAVLQPHIKNGIMGSKHCGRPSCRTLVKTLKEYIASMASTAEAAGTCTAANAAKCLPGADGLIAGTSEECSKPAFGAKASQKFPLRWYNPNKIFGKTYSTTDDAQYKSMDENWMYWQACSMTEECPVDGPAAFIITITFVIDATVDTFDAAGFKTSLAAYLNQKTNAGVAPRDIKLKITPGSINVEASIEVYSESVRTVVSNSLEAATPTELASALGVKVLSKTAPSSIALDKSGNTLGGGVAPGVIGGVAGGVGVFALLVVIVCIFKRRANGRCCSTKTSSQPKFTPKASALSPRDQPTQLIAHVQPTATAVASVPQKAPPPPPPPPPPPKPKAAPTSPAPPKNEEEPSSIGQMLGELSHRLSRSLNLETTSAPTQASIPEDGKV